MQDWSRRHREIPAADDLDPAAPMPSFDRLWTLYLVERAFARLKETSPGVVRGPAQSSRRREPPTRNKLWIARNKLSALIRHEISLTCRTPEELEAEVAALSPYLRPEK